MQSFICSNTGFPYSYNEIEAPANSASRKPLYSPHILFTLSTNQIAEILKTQQNTRHSALISLILSTRLPCVQFRAGNYSLFLDSFSEFSLPYDLVDCCHFIEETTVENPLLYGIEHFSLTPTNANELPAYVNNLLRTIKTNYNARNVRNASSLSNEAYDALVRTPIELDSEYAQARAMATRTGLIRITSNISAWLIENCVDFNETLYTRLKQIICDNKRYSSDALSELITYLNLNLPIHTRKQQLEKEALIGALEKHKIKAPQCETKAQKEQAQKELSSLLATNPAKYVTGNKKAESAESNYKIVDSPETKAKRDKLKALLAKHKR